jgi:3-oxoadipate enol-lactonase
MPIIKVNNVELFYSEQGSGDETMVFGHGLLMDSSMWDFVAPQFVDQYRVICFDFRGQGQSSDPGHDYDIGTLVQDAAALIQALSTKPVHYVGLSMGGMVGLPLAARHPDLLRSMVLLDTSAQAEPWLNKIKYALMAWVLRFFGVKPLVPQTLPLMFGKTSLQDPSKRELIQVWKQKLLLLRKSVIGPIVGVTQRRDVTQELAKITCPTIVIVGEEDRTTPMLCAQHIHVHIPHSVLK